jgi:hypothetical protein
MSGALPDGMLDFTVLEQLSDVRAPRPRHSDRRVRFIAS